MATSAQQGGRQVDTVVKQKVPSHSVSLDQQGTQHESS